MSPKLGICSVSRAINIFLIPEHGRCDTRKGAALFQTPLWENTAADKSLRKDGDRLRDVFPHDPLTDLPSRQFLLDRLKQALAHNIRDRCIRMIEQGYRTAAEQQPFFPDVPPDVLGYVFAEPFVERLAASEPPGEKQG